MSNKTTEDVKNNYFWNLSDINLVDKYFYKKSNLWEVFKWKNWLEKLDLDESQINNLIDEFKSFEILKSKNDFWLINLTKKLRDKFKEEQFLDEIFIIEPYTFSNLWKTKYWWEMHDAKWNSDIKIIKSFSKRLYDFYLKLDEKYKFKYIWIIPPTLKGRKIQIMDFIKDYFIIKNDDLNFLNISKIDWMPSQKSLSKFNDRMENAKRSFYLWEKNKDLWNILLIDDAIWSWTTLNYVAWKIKQNNNCWKVVWLSIVWSMRWFDIIKEI